MQEAPYKHVADLMNTIFPTKLAALLTVLTLATAVGACAKDIKKGTSTQITGTLTVENGSDLFISTGDFIAADKRYPVTHIGVWPCEQKSSGHYQTLLKTAGTGKASYHSRLLSPNYR